MNSQTGDTTIASGDRKLLDLFDLSGRIAIITGGGRGLGLQLARALGEFSARLVLVSRKLADLESAVAELAAEGIAAEAVAADLTTPGAADALIDEVLRRHGRIDILVNNAGAAWGAPAAEYSDDAWAKMLKLNLTAPFTLARSAARAAFLRQRSGAIINVASTEGLGAHHPQMPGTIGYNAAKGGVINMTRALAAEWGPHGIRVNALAPGFFPSKMTDVLLEHHGDYLLSQTPLGRLGGANDLKGAALLLASDAGNHITGQVIVIDGGALVV